MTTTRTTTLARTAFLTIAVLWSLPASAGDLPPASVYVAPGGVYVGSGNVYVAPNGVGNGDQPYAVPGPTYGHDYGREYGREYGAPAPVYAPQYGVPGAVYDPGYARRYRAPPLSVYGAAPVVRPRVYAAPYAAEYAPRPPVAVPYGRGSHCVVSQGRVFCD
jgi:hypothetical protein